MKFKAHRTISSRICSIPCPEGETVDLPDDLAKELEAKGLGVAGGPGRPKTGRPASGRKPIEVEITPDPEVSEENG